MAFGKSMPAQGRALNGHDDLSVTVSKEAGIGAAITHGVWGDGAASAPRDHFTKERARLIGNVTGVGVRIFLIMIVGWVSLSEEVYVPILDDFSIWVVIAMLGELTRVLAKMMKPGD